MPSSPTPPASERSIAAALIARQDEAFEALLSLVVEHARIHKGGTSDLGVIFGSEHRIWVRWDVWRAGAQSVDEAREALKDVIRAALIEQTGGTDAAP
jgi:hypothetical protein